MNFLTKEQFENQAFIHYLRMGEVYYYEDYFKWIEKFRMLEKLKIFKNYFQVLKEEASKIENTLPQESPKKENTRYVVWRSGKRSKKEKKNYADISISSTIYIYAYPNKDEGGGDEEEAEGEPCEACAKLESEVFEEESEPKKPHPNCNCTAEYIYPI